MSIELDSEKDARYKKIILWCRRNGIKEGKFRLVDGTVISFRRAK